MLRSAPSFEVIGTFFVVKALIWGARIEMSLRQLLVPLRNMNFLIEIVIKPLDFAGEVSEKTFECILIFENHSLQKCAPDPPTDVSQSYQHSQDLNQYTCLSELFTPKTKLLRNNNGVGCIIIIIIIIFVKRL